MSLQLSFNSPLIGRVSNQNYGLGRGGGGGGLEYKKGRGARRLA